MKNSDSYAFGIIILITVLYLYNSGRLSAIKRIIDDKTYQLNFGASHGIKLSGSGHSTDIFQSIAGGLQDILGIAGLFA